MAEEPTTKEKIMNDYTDNTDNQEDLERIYWMPVAPDDYEQFVLDHQGYCIEEPDLEVEHDHKRFPNWHLFKASGIAVAALVAVFALSACDPDISPEEEMFKSTSAPQATAAPIQIAQGCINDTFTTQVFKTNETGEMEVFFEEYSHNVPDCNAELTTEELGTAGDLDGWSVDAWCWGEDRKFEVRSTDGAVDAEGKPVQWKNTVKAHPACIEGESE